MKNDLSIPVDITEWLFYTLHLLNISDQLCHGHTVVVEQKAYCTCYQGMKMPFTALARGKSDWHQSDTHHDILLVLHLYFWTIMSVSISDLWVWRQGLDSPDDSGDALSTLKAMTLAQKNYQCCCGSLMEKVSVSSVQNSTHKNLNVSPSLQVQESNSMIYC